MTDADMMTVKKNHITDFCHVDNPDEACSWLIIDLLKLTLTTIIF